MSDLRRAAALFREGRDEEALVITAEIERRSREAEQEALGLTDEEFAELQRICRLSDAEAAARFAEEVLPAPGQLSTGLLPT